MIDPNSIKQIKYKNEDAVLACMLLGASVRASALRCCVSSKTTHKIRLKHADKFPKKEKVVKEVRTPKIPGVKRWVTVPPDVDVKIVEASKENSRTWQDQANLIFDEWGEDEQ